jgi:transcriptional regulator GlxA family with amidase domain
MVTTRRSRVVCCLYPGFDVLDVALFTGVLAEAGRRWNHLAFEIVLAATAVGPVEGVSAAMVATIGLSNLTAPDVFFVPGGRGALQASSDETLVTDLTRVTRGVTTFGACGTGQLLLAAAGRLANSVVCAEGSLWTELEKRLGEPLPAPGKEVEMEGGWLIASKSLLVSKLAFQLVKTTLGRSEADAVAAALGQSPRDVLFRIKH